MQNLQAQLSNLYSRSRLQPLPHPSIKRNHLPSQDKTNMRTFGFGSRGFPEAALCVEESIRSQSNSLKFIQYWLQTALLSDCKLSHACGSNCGIVCGTWQSVAHLPGVTVSQQCKTSCRLKWFQLVDLFVGKGHCVWKAGDLNRDHKSFPHNSFKSMLITGSSGEN